MRTRAMGGGDFLGVFGLCRRDGAVLLAANRRVLAAGAPPSLTFDLPGGRVESGETLAEALTREWREETGLAVSPGRFLFVQEGRLPGRRPRVWRSFFFEVRTPDAEPAPHGEVEALLWCPEGRLRRLLTAPYHAGFLRWLEDGGLFQRDVWKNAPGAS